MSQSLKIVCPSCLTVNQLPHSKLADSGKCGQCKDALFAGEPLELTSQNSEKHLRYTELPLVIDFWASWCGPCQMFAPVFAHAASDLEPQARFAKIDTQREPDLGTRFNVQSIPTLIVIQNGKEVARQSGAMSSSQFTHWLKPYLLTP